MQEALKQLDEELGGYGRFQKWVFFLACLGPVMTGLSVVNQVFIALVVPHRCAVPECETGNAASAVYTEAFLNFTTPLDDTLGHWDTCHTYGRVHNTSANASCLAEKFDSEEKEECSEWVYDRSLFRTTVVTEFDLTCDASWMQSLGGSMYMFGMPFGAVLLGDIADRIGRRRGLVVSIVILGAGEVLSSISMNFYMFLAMRFLSGLGGIGVFQISIVLALEVVSSKWRTFCGMMIKVPFALGETAVAAFAYFIRDWRWLQLALGLPSFLLVSYWWIMPESIRWSISKGRFSEAKKTIDKAAAMNNTVVSQDVYEALVCEERPTNLKSEESVRVKRRSAFDLFKSPRLRIRTLILIFSWIAITHDFYGLSSNSANFGGNIFVNFVSIMLVEVPSYVIAYLILDKLGRKGTLVLLLFSGGASCFVASLIPEEYSLVIILLSMTAKFCIAAAFAVIYIYTIEIFPTQYRSLGLGTCSMSARLGGILAPFTAGMGSYYRALPLIIFGSLAILCAVMLLILPETLGSELPQTLEESEKYGVEQPTLFFTCCKKKVKKASSDPSETEMVKLNSTRP